MYNLTSIYNEIHQMEPLLCSPLEFRYSYLNPNKLNLETWAITHCIRRYYKNKMLHSLSHDSYLI